jgi:RecA-family ATPase
MNNPAEKKDKIFYLTQRRDGNLKIVSNNSPLINNLKLASGTELHCHVQRLDESFPPHFEITKDDTSKNNNTRIEEEEDLKILEDFQLDLTKEIYTLTELLSMKETKIPFLLEKLIPEKAITFLAGDSDTGKSLLYTQLATAIIEGKTEFLGLKLKAPLGKVLMLNSEDSPISISVRVKMQLSGKILSKEVSNKLSILANSQDAARKIEKILSKNPVDLVVIDAFADVFGEDINSSSAVRNFLNQFEALIQKYGCTVLIVHHIGKGKETLAANKSHMLGSVGTHGKARSVIMLSKPQSDSNFKSLKIVKNNYLGEDEKKQEILLEFDPKTLLHKTVSEESLTKETLKQLKQVSKPKTRKSTKTDLSRQEAMRLRNEGYTLEAIGEKMGRDKTTICRYLKDYKPPYDVSEVV